MTEGTEEGGTLLLWAEKRPDEPPLLVWPFETPLRPAQLPTDPSKLVALALLTQWGHTSWQCRSPVLLPFRRRRPTPLPTSAARLLHASMTSSTPANHAQTQFKPTLARFLFTFPAFFFCDVRNGQMDRQRSCTRRVPFLRSETLSKHASLPRLKGDLSCLRILRGQADDSDGSEDTQDTQLILFIPLIHQSYC